MPIQTRIVKTYLNSRNAAILMLSVFLAAGCTSVGIQYRKYTGDIKSILLLSDNGVLARQLKVDLSRSEYKVGIFEEVTSNSTDTLDFNTKSQSNSDLRTIKNLGYDSILVLNVDVGGDGYPNSVVLNLLDTSNGRKSIAGTWVGSGDDYTKFGYDPSPEYKKLILDGRKTFDQASIEISNILVKEIPKSWW